MEFSRTFWQLEDYAFPIDEQTSAAPRCCLLARHRTQRPRCRLYAWVARAFPGLAKREKAPRWESNAWSCNFVLPAPSLLPPSIQFRYLLFCSYSRLGFTGRSCIAESSRAPDTHPVCRAHLFSTQMERAFAEIVSATWPLSPGVGLPVKLVLGPALTASLARCSTTFCYLTAKSFSNNSPDSLAPSSDNHTDLFFVAGSEI
jgi:hypothetical protein